MLEMEIREAWKVCLGRKQTLERRERLLGGNQKIKAYSCDLYHVDAVNLKPCELGF
jgi:hypothetical protein